jgi:hypothetical protein
MMFFKGVPDDLSLLKVREILLRFRKKLEKSDAQTFDALLALWWKVFKKSPEITYEQAIARAILEFLDILLNDVIVPFDEATEKPPSMREMIDELPPDLRKELLTTFWTTLLKELRTKFLNELFTPKSQ